MLLLCALFFSLANVASANYETFTLRYSADPSPLVVGDRLWMYTSHDFTNQTGWLMKDYNAFSSDDLVNWRDEGIPFTLEGTAWANYYAWAQQTVQLANGTFVMFYPAQPLGVGVAVAESPAGPFRAVVDTPLMPGDDPTVHFDEASGSYVLCSAHGGPYCGVLNSDLISWKTPPAKLPQKSFPHFFEAPWLLRIGSTYYLSYMMSTGDCPGGDTSPQCGWSHYGFDIGYSRSTTGPLGNYTWMGTLQWSPPFDCFTTRPGACNESGGNNNHQGVAEYPANSGIYYFAYHDRKLAQENNQYIGYQRNVALDRLYVGEDGTLLPVSATPNWLRQLKYINPYLQTPAFLMAEGSVGLATEASTDEPLPGTQRLDLGSTFNGAFIRVQGVDFGPVSPTTVLLRVATPLDSTSISIYARARQNFDAEVLRRDGQTPPETRQDPILIAQCKIPNTGGWQQWRTVECDLLPWLMNVQQDLYFTFNCSQCVGGVLNFAWWQFTGPSVRPSGVAPPAFAVNVSIGTSRLGGPSRLWTACANSSSIMAATATHADACAFLTLLDNDDGSWSILIAPMGRIVCVNTSLPGAPLTAVPLGATVGNCARFRMQGTTLGSFAVWSYETQRWVTAVAGGEVTAGSAVDPRGLDDDRGRFEVVEL